MSLPAQADFTPVELLTESRSASVWRGQGPGGEPLVLKRYRTDPARVEREREFLLGVRDGRFEHLRFPRVVEAGADHIVLEFLDREQHTRESLVEREWTARDVDLWVRGLLEFQALRPDRRTFTAKQRALGLVYPVVRTIAGLRRYPTRVLTARQRLTLARLVAGYLLLRPLWRNVCVHYDLQSTNYTFMAGEERMSLIDCDFSYYLGDAFFDVAYYVTIPVEPLAAWDFQTRLLRSFLRLAPQRRAATLRLRLSLMCCTISRYLRFADDPARREVYADNLRALLDEREFAALLSSISPRA